LAIAAAMLWGRGVWPGILAGAFLANVTTSGSAPISLAIAAGNTLEAVAAAWLLARWSRGRKTFDSAAGVGRFALIAAVATTLSATIGVTSLSIGGLAPWADYPMLWVTWWVGDLGGALVIAPVIVLWAASGSASLLPREVALTAAVVFLALLVGLVAFSPLVPLTAFSGPLAFLAILPLMWAALERGQRDTATVALVLSACAVWGVLTGDGPFMRPTLNSTFLLLLSFVISAAVPSLALSAHVAEQRRTERRQVLLMAELDHRVRNILATVQSVVRMTAAAADSKEDLAQAVEGRIAAMARAHGLLARGRWEGMSLPELIRDGIGTFAAGEGTLGLAVPDLLIGARQALNLRLVVHELATNAVKYGALSSPGGRVDVSGRIDDGPEGQRLVLAWCERGGPPAQRPAQPGFGLNLIEHALDADGGRTRLHFASEGVNCVIELPAPQ
jgi:two-component sensor histidine kinase/integral membrane sensor domain MASE1